MGKIEEALQRLRTDAPPSSAPVKRDASQYRPRVRRANELGIRSAQNLEIDWQLLAKHGLLAENLAASEISQQFRRIKRPLLRQIFESYPISSDDTGRVLLVASALRGEGKSFTSLNLALAITIEPELQVLLVDGDAPKQGLTTGFGLEDRLGLLDVAADETIDPAHCIFETSQDGLYVMPAGQCRSNSPELLGSSRMHKLLTEVARTSGPCVIIIDSPPVLLANEARALLSLSDYTMFVVHSGETNVNVVESALESIGGTENVYMLLNQSGSVISSEQIYGYGYGIAVEDSAGSGG